MIGSTNLLLAGDDGYNLTRSLRSRASASAYLSRTPASAGNRKTWTWSAWVKRGKLGSNQVLFISKPSGTTDATFTDIGFSSSDTLLVSGLSVQWKNTTQVFRDPSAWYHIVVTWDTTQATASNRVRVYVNGSQVTAFGTTFDPSLNFDGAINQADVHALGRADGYSAGYFDGYMTEVNFIDGQALTPSSFGSTNSTTGVWQPAKYTGTYGTNGFYLPFTDNSALTTSSNVGLGKDFSGNGNYWTTNNISLTAGVTYDSMTDVPTLTSASAANFAVLNPLSQSSGASITNGNLTLTGGNVGTVSTIIPSSGKWYWEVTLLDPYVAAANYFGGFGVTNGLVATYEPTLYGAGVRAYNTGGAGGGGTYVNNTQITSSGTWAVNDVIGFAFDVTNLTLDCYRNNVKIGTTLTVPAGYIYPTFYQNGTADTSSSAANFGQRPFSYTPPTGFVALNTYNLPDSTILKGNKVMDATLYTGNMIGQVITNAATFQPDLVWVKSRSAATDNKLTDSVRGATKALISNTTGAETTDITGVVSFNSNGFTLGTSTTYNNLAATYVAWQWQAGAGSSSSNTNGTITSTVSVNASAGFSVVAYTGTGANATVGHGLGIAPSFIIVKCRNTAGENWQVYSSSLTSAAYRLRLNTSDAQDSQPTMWNSTAPTSSVFSIGTATGANGNAQTYVAYCFAPIAGYSAFGSYIGNGSADGSFVYLGLKARYIMIKRIDVVGYDWTILDTAINTYNVASNYLLADSAQAEASTTLADILSNGFKQRTTSGSVNANGGTYIYFAFASNPFKNSLAR